MPLPPALPLPVANSSFRAVWPYVDKVLRAASPKTDVIVLDIDATVLYNTDREPLVGAVPNFKMQPLYDTARTRRIPVHFVTARVGTKENRIATLQQLRAMGFDWFDTLFMRPTAVPPTVLNIARYKANARRAIAQGGNKRIVINAGDQWSDILVVDDAAMRMLDARFPEQHVVMHPPANDALLSLKLYETRD